MTRYRLHKHNPKRKIFTLRIEEKVINSFDKTSLLYYHYKNKIMEVAVMNQCQHLFTLNRDDDL